MANKRKKEIKVKKGKLGRRRYQGYQIYGWADEKKRVIEIDSRLQGKKKMRVLIHEAVHVAEPSLSESEVEKIEKLVGETLWSEGYRFVELK